MQKPAMQSIRAGLARFVSKLADDCWRSAQLVVFFVVAAGTFAVPPGTTTSAFAALQSIEAQIVELHAAVIERIAFMPNFSIEERKPLTQHPVLQPQGAMRAPGELQIVSHDN